MAEKIRLSAGPMRETSTRMESVCIVDIWGDDDEGNEISLSADWYPSEGLVRFSGDWEEVPAMHARTQPTGDQIHEWARAHGWWRR